MWLFVFIGFKGGIPLWIGRKVWDALSMEQRGLRLCYRAMRSQTCAAVLKIISCKSSQ